MGNKKECSCSYWNQAQQECLYHGLGCIHDEDTRLEVTEEWIKEKARELCEQNYVNNEARDFIRSLVDEIQGSKDKKESQQYVDDAQRRRW